MRGSPEHLGRVWLVALPAACGTERPAEREFVVRDSAGITIGESLGPQWPEGRGWVLSAEPILEVGVVQGEPVYQLHDVVHVARTADGSTLVANRGTKEIRVYGMDGRFPQSIGGQGGGPGEFNDMVRFQARRADSIVAVETRPLKITAFSPSGDLAWTKTLDLKFGEFVPESCSDGSVVAASASGIRRMLVLSYDPSGASRLERVLVRP